MHAYFMHQGAPKQALLQCAIALLSLVFENLKSSQDRSWISKVKFVCLFLCPLPTFVFVLRRTAKKESEG